MVNVRRGILKGLAAAALAAVMLVGTAVTGLSVSAAQYMGVSAASATEQRGNYEGFEWTLNSFGNEKYVTIEGYNGKSKNPVIPDKINGYKVMEISSAFKDMKYLRSITISKNIKLINRDFARNCDKLENIFVSPQNEDYSSVKGYLCDKQGKILYRAPIGKSGIAYIPPDIETIEQLAFENCRNITKVVTKSKVRFIGYHAFYGCDKLEEALIRGDIESVDMSFEGCPALKSIELTGSQSSYMTADGVLYKTNGAQSLPVSLVRYPAGKGASADESGSPEGYGKYTVPDHVVRIESRAFADCTGLLTVNIHRNVSYIEQSAFDNTSVTEINVNAKNKYYRFKNGMLIGRKAGDESRSGDVIIRVMPAASGRLVIPSSITEIMPEAFKSCNIDDVYIPNSIVRIGGSAFEGCEMLRKITIPASVDTIEQFTFSGCRRLVSVTVEAEAKSRKKSIGYGAFYECPNLVIAKLPKAVTEIDDDAFMGDTAVTVYGKSGSYPLEYARRHGMMRSIYAPELKAICIACETVKDPARIMVEADAAGGKGGYEFAVYYKKASSSKWVCAKEYSAARTARIRPGSRTDYQIMIKVKDKVGKVAQKTVNISSDTLSL